ncbi:UNVERIFIED_CONTAM: hypothetical protein PYX00_004896 [Menopon gallinae]|uniref:Reverse transcriptase zinc-binding domain-containing protein n=1 Tax=Menopon gallinae TaxID=328185 RepID=A0AAW2I5N8_9NEOP
MELQFCNANPSAQGYGTISFEAVDLIARVIPLEWFYYKRILLYRCKQYLHSQQKITDIQLGLRFENSKIHDIIDNSEVGFKEIANRIQEHIYTEWQKQWHSSVKGRITFKFFPSVKQRMQNKKIHIDFHTTQVFSGHGNFADYLQKFNLKDDPTCTNCNRCAIDSVEHMLLECPAWSDFRQKYKISPPNNVSWIKLISDQSNFSAFVKHTMIVKNKN